GDVTEAPPAPDPVRGRPALLLAVAGGAGLAVAAVYLRSDVLLFVALPLLLAPGAGLFHAPPSPAAASLAWAGEGAAGEVTIEGRVTLAAGTESDQLDVTFYRPAPLVEEGPPVLERGPASIRFSLRWRAPFPCIVTVPRPEVVWRDRLGLLERRI